jgi:hypothetical protein
MLNTTHLRVKSLHSSLKVNPYYCHTILPLLPEWMMYTYTQQEIIQLSTTHTYKEIQNIQS